MNQPAGVFLAVFLFLTASAPPAAAQSVRGQLLEEGRERPIPGARLLLFNAAGNPVDSTQSDPTGRFRMGAPAAGVHYLYFQMDGWASITSDSVVLREEVTAEFDFRVPLTGSAALRQMSDIIRMEPRLQAALPEICGEAFRPWEAGLLVGVVRARGTDRPIAGARVSVAGGGDQVVRSTVSSENGVYVLCNVPVGVAVSIIAVSPAGVADTSQVEIRAGTASWYDLTVGAEPRARRQAPRMN